MSVLVKNNQVWQLVKFMILSMSCTHVRDLSMPAYNLFPKKLSEMVISNNSAVNLVTVFCTNFPKKVIFGPKQKKHRRIQHVRIPRFFYKKSF